MEELWLLVALAAIVVVAAKPFREKVLGSLDKRGEAIREELAEAKRLREDAQALLAKHNKQLAEVEETTRTMLARAQNDAESITARMKADMDNAMTRRSEQAEQRIAAAEASAVQEVRSAAAELTLATTKRLLDEQLDQGKRQDLTAQAIEQVGRQLH